MHLFPPPSTFVYPSQRFLLFHQSSSSLLYLLHCQIPSSSFNLTLTLSLSSLTVRISHAWSLLMRLPPAGAEGTKTLHHPPLKSLVSLGLLDFGEGVSRLCGHPEARESCQPDTRRSSRRSSQRSPSLLLQPLKSLLVPRTLPIRALENDQPGVPPTYDFGAPTWEGGALCHGRVKHGRSS